MWAMTGDRKLFTALIAALIALAWLALWIWGQPPYGGFHNHHSPDAFGGGILLMLLFLAGWTVMVMAMMLPTSLPLIQLFRAITRRRQDRTLLAALLITGYLSIWMLFGALVYFGGWFLYQAVRQSGWLEANLWILGAGTVMLAGLYQFTPLKYYCLDKCRSPLSFIMEHWKGSHERSQALRLGMHHGLFCVGCCWSLMLLMFVVGAGSIFWMLALGAVMAIEKNMPWGRRISAPLGVVLVGWGLTLGAASALQSPGDTFTKIPLAPSNNSGMSGTAAFTDTSGGVEVKLDVQGLPDSGATYLAHINPGSCPGKLTGSANGNAHDHGGDANDHAHSHHSSAGETADDSEHPLTPLVSNSEGGGASTTVIKDATIDQLFSGGESYISVHPESPSTEELPSSVSCSDLRKPD